MKVVPCIWMCVCVTQWRMRERVIAQSYVTSWPLHVKQHVVQCQWLQQRYACLDVCLTVPTISLKRFSLLGFHLVSPAWGNSGIQWKDQQFWQFNVSFKFYLQVADFYEFRYWETYDTHITLIHTSVFITRWLCTTCLHYSFPSIIIYFISYIIFYSYIYM